LGFEVLQLADIRVDGGDGAGGAVVFEIPDTLDGQAFIAFLQSVWELCWQS
jgi:hypothetical protein